MTTAFGPLNHLYFVLFALQIKQKVLHFVIIGMFFANQLLDNINDV